MSYNAYIDFVKLYFSIPLLVIYWCTDLILITIKKKKLERRVYKKKKKKRFVPICSVRKI